MIEELRIKCPSCGIVLDVRNSRHEAVKRIACPNCKKQLAVDFQDTEEKTAVAPKPIGALYYGELRIDLQEGVNWLSLPGFEQVEIKTVQLTDGNSKCMVRQLGDATVVKVNNEALQPGDQIVLATGDCLQVANAVLFFNRPGNAQPPVPDGEPAPPSPGSSSFKWVYTTTAIAILVLAVALLWPTKKSNEKEPLVAPESVRPTVEKKAVPAKPVKPTVKPHVTPPSTTPVPPSKPSELSDFELEQKAAKGSVDARLELGKRLVKRQGVNNVALGINYLRLASKDGSKEASQLLASALNALQRRADNGDSAAYRVLLLIDNQ